MNSLQSGLHATSEQVGLHFAVGGPVSPKPIHFEKRFRRYQIGSLGMFLRIETRSLKYASARS